MTIPTHFQRLAAQFQREGMEISLWLKRQKLSKGGTAPVSLRITIGGKRTEVSTGLRLPPEQWDPVRSAVRGTGQLAIQQNEQLQLMVAHVREMANLMRAHGKPITVQTLRTQLQQPFEPEGPCFIELCAQQLTLHYHNAHPATRRAKEMAMYHLRAWHPKGKLPLSEFTPPKANEFYLWMLHTRGLKPSSASSTVQNLVSLFRLAVDAGLADILQHPFRALRRKRNVKTDSLRLSQEEFVRLRDAPLKGKRALIRDIFVAQYYLHGSRIGAVMKLRRQDIKNGVVGLQCEKSGPFKKIPVVPELQQVLDRQPRTRPDSAPLFELLPEEFHTLDAEQQYCLRHKAVARANYYLKYLAKELGIAGCLHSHTARHTLAAHAAEVGGMRVAQVMLGHANLRMTEIYTGVVRDTIVEAAVNAIYQPVATPPPTPPAPPAPAASEEPTEETGRIIPFPIPTSRNIHIQQR